MISLDFAEIETLQQSGNWQVAAKILGHEAAKLQAAGADFILLCTNTMHLVADTIESNIRIPFLHIADITADRIIDEGFSKVGLLGTRFTLEEDFYIDRLKSKGLEVVVPETEDISSVNRIIFDELVKGIIDPRSKRLYLDVIHRMVQNGSQCIILGCTEIGLLVKQQDIDTRTFDTTLIHAKHAAELALKQ
jgi:aspartate racemase